MKLLYVVHDRLGKILGIFKDRHNAELRAERAVDHWYVNESDIIIDDVETDLF